MVKMYFNSHLILFLCLWDYYGDFVNSDEEIKLSKGEECFRECRKNETRKFCHYEFNLEAYPALNKACELCKPDINQGLLNKPTCECILADGIERTVFSVNRMLPGPHIQVCKDDFVIIDVTNKIEGTETSLHWHGLFQNGYQYYDGVPFVTQCPINQFQSFRYQFHLKQSGTYFWHSHVSIQRLDGLYGPFIVRDDPEDDPHSKLYDIDDPTHVILISDWFHELSMDRFPGLLKRHFGQHARNVLINGRGVYKMHNGTVTDVELAKFTVEEGKRYRFRLINSFTTTCLAQFRIQNHELLIIAQDGANVEPISVKTIITGAGERVDFIINTTNTVKSYWIQVKALGECEDHSVQQLAILEYKGQPEEEMTDEPDYSNGIRGIMYNPFNTSCTGINGDGICPSDIKSIDEIHPDLLNVKPDIRYVMPFAFHFFESDEQLEILYSANKSDYLPFIVPLGQASLLGMVEDVIFESPPAPPLTQSEGYEHSCDGKNSPVCEKSEGPVPCMCTHIKEIPLNSVVEIILYDQEQTPDLIHPFHLHGHKFQLFDTGKFDNKSFISTDDIQTVIDEHDKRLSNGFYNLHQPPKDTVLVPQGGWVIFRFRAVNPGIWMFHCHFDFHHVTGMQVLFKIGESEDLPPVPPEFPRCGNFKPPIDFHE